MGRSTSGPLLGISVFVSPVLAHQEQTATQGTKRLLKKRKIERPTFSSNRWIMLVSSTRRTKLAFEESQEQTADYFSSVPVGVGV